MHCSKKAVAGLCLLRFRPHESAALQALGRPHCVKIVEFRNRPGARWQRHPRLLGRRENVDVRRTEIRVVHGANADEPDGGTGLRVVAPNRDTAGRAAGDLLPLAARRGRHDDFGLTGGVHDTIGFIESVESMRSPGLALAPTAMAGMNNQRCSDQTISDLPAGASAFHFLLGIHSITSSAVLAAGARDDLAEQLPRRAVKFLKLHLLDRSEIVRAGVDSDAGQLHRQLQIVDAGRLLHYVLAGEIITARAEHGDQCLRCRVAVDGFNISDID